MNDPTAALADAKEISMTTCRILVQEGQISPDQRADLEAKLTDFSATKLGSPAKVQWREIASGSGYTATKPSTTSVVVLTGDTPLDQPVRVALLHELVDFWTKGAGCSIDEITAVIGDPVPA